MSEHPMIDHSTVDVNGTRLHVARAGRGRQLLLLHGWPEFWLTWVPMIERLQDRFELIVPDLRGFGDSAKPTADSTVDDFGPDAHAEDMAALIRLLSNRPVGVVAHDVGATVAQTLARRTPEVVAGLFFFNFVYPGIGQRFYAPSQLSRVWHTFFNQSEVAAELLRSSPSGIRLYISHFVRLWSGRKDAVDQETVDAFVATMEKPGNLEGGFAYYRGAAARRVREYEAEDVPVPIDRPTAVRWTEHDSALDIAWADRLPDYFSNLDFAPFPGAGHFPHHEEPDRAAHEIAAFFERLPPTVWAAR